MIGFFLLSSREQTNLGVREGRTVLLA